MEELQGIYRNSKTAITKRRCLSIMLLRTGSPAEQVCKVLEIDDRTLRNYVHAFNFCGVDGLIVKKQPGAPKKIQNLLAKELEEELSDPTQAGRTFWTAKAFHGYVCHKYALECSYQTVVRFFHEKGYSLQVPRPWPDRQDETARDLFRQQLKELCQDENTDLWFGDETGIDGEPRPRRRWAPKGKSPKVVRNGDHIRMSIAGTVCPRTGEFFGIEVPYSDTETFQIFLDEAAKCIQPMRPRNILILDNAAWHKRKSLKWHFFEPLYLPAYSPDLNPIERIWLVLKAEWFNNIHCKTVDELIQRMDQAILHLVSNPENVAKTSTIHFGKN